MITAARQKVEEMQQAYEMCLAEDKDLDKSFKKEFADCEPHVDQLYKLYRKRPRCTHHTPHTRQYYVHALYAGHCVYTVLRT